MTRSALVVVLALAAGLASPAIREGGSLLAGGAEAAETPAATLEEVLTTANQNDRHGKTSHLTSNEIADLVQFLKSLPYEDPEPLAKAAGITKVER